jgi:hypothetical protein
VTNSSLSPAAHTGCSPVRLDTAGREGFFIDDPFAEQFTAEYDLVLSGWKEARRAAGLSFVKDRRTLCGASTLSRMLREKEITLEQISQAMVNLMQNTTERTRYTLDGLANNLSLWVDGGPQDAKPEKKQAEQKIKPKQKCPADYCEHCGGFVGKDNRRVRVTIITGEKQNPSCKTCGKEIKCSL